MKALSTNVASSFFMPNYSWEDLQWDTYSLQLETALHDAKTNQPLDRRAKGELRRLDYLLGKFMRQIPADFNDKVEYDCSIHFERDKFPSEYDLNTKFYKLISSARVEKGVSLEDVTGQYKAYANATADCQRVIKRIINSEPLRLIPNQVKTFEKFLSIIKYASIEGNSLRRPIEYED